MFQHEPTSSEKQQLVVAREASQVLVMYLQRVADCARLYPSLILSTEDFDALRDKVKEHLECGAGNLAEQLAIRAVEQKLALFGPTVVGALHASSTAAGLATLADQVLSSIEPDAVLTFHVLVSASAPIDRPERPKWDKSLADLVIGGDPDDPFIVHPSQIVVGEAGPDSLQTLRHNLVKALYGFHHVKVLAQLEAEFAKALDKAAAGKRHYRDEGSTLGLKQANLPRLLGDGRRVGGRRTVPVLLRRRAVG